MLFKPLYVKSSQCLYRIDCCSSSSRCADDDVTADPEEELKALLVQSAFRIPLTLDADLQIFDGQNSTDVRFGCMV